MADIFRNAYLKVKRANRHIDSLIHDSSPLSKDLYEITNGPIRSVAPLAQFDCFALAYRPKEPIPEHFAAIIGDAINNLREALDYWTNIAVAAVGPPRKVYFPFSEKWEDLETSSNYPAIKKAFPDLAEFIRHEIKPCRNTNLDLWAATHLGNFNKHNDFLPTVTLAEITDINARIDGLILHNVTVGGNANGPIGIGRGSSPITVNQNFRTSVEVVFPEGAIFQNQPVIPTLANMSKVVKETLDALVRFMRPYLK